MSVAVGFAWHGLLFPTESRALSVLKSLFTCLPWSIIYSLLMQLPWRLGAPHTVPGSADRSIYQEREASSHVTKAHSLLIKWRAGQLINTGWRVLGAAGWRRAEPWHLYPSVPGRWDFPFRAGDFPFRLSATIRPATILLRSSLAPLLFCSLILTLGPEYRRTFLCV